MNAYIVILCCDKELFLFILSLVLHTQLTVEVPGRESLCSSAVSYIHVA